MDFRTKYGQWALILGASEGIGEALAKQLAGAGMDVILVGRRTELLNGVAASVEKTYGVQAMVKTYDLAQPDTIDKIYEETKDLDIGFVTYVAAFAPGGLYHTNPYELYEEALQTNVLSLTRCTYLYYKLFRERDRGAILNVGSGSSVMGAPGLAEYAATKAYILSFTRSLAQEAIDTNVEIATCLLGLILTPAALKNLPQGPVGEYALKVAQTPEDAMAEVFQRWDEERPVIVCGENSRESYCKYLPVQSKEEIRASMSMYG